MHFTSLTAASLLSLASAHVLSRTDTCYALGGTTCTDLVIGQKSTGKQVCTTVSGSNLIVNYPAVSGYPYSEVHVYLGAEPPKSHSPGQFPFTSGNGYCKVSAGGSTATCTIPIAEFGACGKSYYIATHSAQETETGWGKGECISKSYEHACAAEHHHHAAACRDHAVDLPINHFHDNRGSGPDALLPACWTTCWKKHGVSSKDEACSKSDATTCVDEDCNADDGSHYHSWIDEDCPAPNPSACLTTVTPSPHTTSTPCPQETSSVETSTFTSTQLTTTVLTNVVTSVATVTRTYTAEGTCAVTVTGAPVIYTTACAARAALQRRLDSVEEVRLSDGEVGGWGVVGMREALGLSRSDSCCPVDGR